MSDNQATQENHPSTEKENAIVANFNSEKLDLEVKTLPKCRVTLNVKARPQILKEAKLEAVKQVAKEVSIPGFRKGKAPQAIIESKYPGAINKAWDQALADVAFKEAQNLAHIPVLNGSSRISYQVTTLKDSEGEISFQFEREPEVPTIDYSIFALKDGEAKKIDAEEVSKTIHGIQMFYARWNQVTDRAVKLGDFVVLNIDDLDQDPPVQAFSSARFEVKEGRMADWMRDAVVGKSLNESIESVSRPDDKESDAVKAEFKPKKVKITITAIEEAILPPLDDEFAKKIGAESMENLNAKLQQLLEKQASNEWQSSLREAIADQILEKVAFEVPGSMLEKEANFRISQLLKNPDFLKKWKDVMTEEEKEAKKNEVVKQAEHAIRLYYICRHILKENKIALSEDDLTPNYESLLDMMFADPNLVNYKNQSREQQAVEFSKYMMSKAQDFIIEKIRSQKI
jgi:trigger factor